MLDLHSSCGSRYQLPHLQRREPRQAGRGAWRARACAEQAGAQPQWPTLCWCGRPAVVLAYQLSECRSASTASISHRSGLLGSRTGCLLLSDDGMEGQQSAGGQVAARRQMVVDGAHGRSREGSGCCERHASVPLEAPRRHMQMQPCLPSGFGAAGCGRFSSGGALRGGRSTDM